MHNGHRQTANRRRHTATVVGWRRFASSINSFCAYATVCIVALCLFSSRPLPAHANIGGLFGEFTLKDEIELGRKFKVLVKSRLPLIEDPEVVGYVKSIVERLKTDMPPQPFAFDVNVIRDSSLNAFAVPGGYVFVNTGFILAMEHESELAGVLGHELAHVTQRHIAGRIEKAQKTQLLSMAGTLAGLFLASQTGANQAGTALAVGSQAASSAAMLNYSRQDERESDIVGLKYLVGGGYPPYGLINGFEKIRKQRWQSGGTFPAYLSTHPDVDERIRDLNNRVSLLPQDIRDRQERDDRFLRVQTLVRARYAQDEVALQYFRKQQAEDDTSALNVMGQGIVLARMNKISEADTMFAKAVSLAPNDALVNREAGRFHYTKGDLEKAASLLQKAILLNPRDYMAMFFFARLQADGGSLKTAYSYFQEILQHLPEDSEVHYYYGRLLGENKQLFKGHLHLAYSALYRNDKKRVEFHLEKAKAAVTPQDQEELDSFIKKYDERKEFWEK